MSSDLTGSYLVISTVGKFSATLPIEMISQVMFTIICVTTGYGILVVLALFASRRGNRRANDYLALFILLLSVSVVIHALQYAGELRTHPQMIYLYAPLGFLYGPLLCFHIGALTDPAGQWTYRNFFRIHAIPFALLTLYLLPSFFTGGARLAMERGYIYFGRDTFVYDLLQNFSLLGYLAASARIIGIFSKVRLPTDTTHIAIYRWSTALILYVSLAISLVLIQVIGRDILASWLIPLVCTGFFGWTGYFWFLFPEAFFSVLSLSSGKYKKSGLKREDMKRFEEKLIRAMESDGHYLNANLSLKLLSTQVGINQVYLSQIINERFGKSFFDFVNSYRIKAAVKRMKAQASPSFLDIAYEVGFNSKSTFYSAFKKETGTTPGKHLGKRPQMESPSDSNPFNIGG